MYSLFGADGLLRFFSQHNNGLNRYDESQSLVSNQALRSTKWFIFALLVIGFMQAPIQAQSIAELPKLLPSYSEDFSDYKSFPSMCFQDAFLDKNGRLWSVTCGVGDQTRLYLFQFDGYAFKAVKGAAEQFPYNTKIMSMTEDGKLAGYIASQEDPRIFFYDVSTDKVTFHEVPVNGEVLAFYSSRDRLMTLSGTTNSYVISEWKGEKMVRIKEIPLSNPSGNERATIDDFEVTYFDENWIWTRVKNGSYLERIAVRSGQRKRFFAKDLPPNGQKTVEEVALLRDGFKKIGETFYIFLTNKKSKNLFLKMEPGTDGFESIPFVPASVSEAFVFNDDTGNKVFAYYLPGIGYRAILEDAEGALFDYTAFVKDLSERQFVAVKSPDFKKQALVFTTQGIRFNLVRNPVKIKTLLPDVAIRAMVELPDRQFLITSQQLSRYLLNGNSWSVSPFPNKDCYLGMTKIMKDDAGFIWGTSGNAIIKYDPKADTCAKFLDQVGQMFTFLGKDSIVYMTYDRSGELLARLYHIPDSREEDLMLKNKPLTIKGFVNGLHYSNGGILWAAASTGLYKIDLARETMEVLGLEAPFLDSRFMCMEEDRKGRLWLGTPLGGLHIYDPATRALKILNSDNGLANNTVASIVEDDDGDFWLGTYNGVSVVSPEGELIGNLYVEDGLVHHEANRFASLKTSDGKLLIGTISGLNVIDPGTLKKRLREPKNLKIYLTRIRYFDDRTQTDADLIYGLNQPGTIYLPAGKRNLRLSFAVSNYFNPEANQYAYMLEGKNEEWVSIGNQHSLNLNDLPAGKYRLLIKGGDDIGNWTAEPLAISIDAGEFFYKQIWFYLLCISLMIGLGALWIYRLRTEIRKATQTIREDKDLIEGQARQLQELDIAKSRFFTNITHEFRTPLTIISGMAGQIMDNPEAWSKKGGEMIKQNSANLLNLVNQILDLRKLEAKELKLNMVQGDVVQYLRYLSQSYEIYARGKGLQLHFLPAIDKLAMDFDPEKLLRILSNLLSNAVKYTPDGGNVYLHVNQSVKNGNPFLSLRVEDTGRGIAEEDLPHIFDRFYQVDASTTRKGEGTGIGLALTQELVNLMNGNIEVKSTPGKGTSFTLWLPITNDSPVLEVSSQDIGQVDSLMVDRPAVQQTKQDDWRTGEQLTDGLPSLLIVEDNPDIRQFLVACLEKSYQLQTATNGQEGIDLALEQVPDLIISDVMMPEKDGFELCEILKNDERTSHIPIILLTAKADMESKISGLKTGADAYLTKPFEQEELMVRLDKLFELRKKLQARYSSLGPETAPENREDEFVQKVRQSVLENISDETYGIAQLCRAVALSRAQLHNKLKALTGQSTSHFVRSIRLHKAKELLESSDLNISEVGYEVGFKNPAHFSSAYFDQFGLPPSKTRK